MSSTLPKPSKRKDSDVSSSSAEQQSGDDEFVNMSPGMKHALLKKFKAELQQKDEVIQQKDEVIQQKDDVIQQNYELIQQKDEVIQQSVGVIQQKDAELNEADKRTHKISLRTLLELNSIQLNKSSMSIPNINPPNKTANVEKKFHYYNSIKLRELPEEFLKSPSYLLQVLIDKGKPVDSNSYEFSYDNEADVAVQLATPALDDALKVIERTTGRKLSVHYERNMLSFRPDMCVVVDKDRETPVLCVEVKAPTNKDSTIFTDKVKGQTFDYLSLMQLLGCGAPFAVATSISETYVCWLDQESCNSIARRERTPIQKEQKKTEQPSSLTITPAPLEIEKPMEFNENFDPEFKGFARKLIQSEMFSPKNLVAALCSALDCATDTTALNYPNSKLLDLTNKWQYNGPALALSKNSYEWGNLKAKANTKVKKYSIRDTKETVTHYVLECVGRGATSNAYNAITTDGKHVVIKMFCKLTKDECVALENNQSMELYMTRSLFLKHAEKKCKEEVKNAKAIYKAKLKDKKSLAKSFSWKMLGGMSCVEMPFFTPLTEGDRKDVAVVSKIRDVLEKFRDSELNYRPTDIQWRHIGKWGEQIVLFDLADLEKVKKNDPNMINNHIQTLQARIPRAL